MSGNLMGYGSIHCLYHNRQAMKPKSPTRYMQLRLQWIINYHTCFTSLLPSSIKHPSQNNLLQVQGINAQCCNFNNWAQTAFSLQTAPTLETASKITIILYLNQVRNLILLKITPSPSTTNISKHIIRLLILVLQWYINWRRMIYSNVHCTNHIFSKT
jgi:hypothetical protein